MNPDTPEPPQPTAAQLERQLERSQLFTHTALSVAFTRVGELAAFLHGTLDLLLAKGLLSEEEVRAAVASVRQELTARGELSGPGLMVRVDPPDSPPPAEVDCAARMPICQAVCCKLNFALTLEEVEGGAVKWDLGQPYTIRKERNGYCTHNDRASGGCQVYAGRPGVCRRYSCAGDRRIWKDFERMELNQEWIDAHLSRPSEPHLIAMFAPESDGQP